MKMLFRIGLAAWLFAMAPAALAQVAGMTPEQAWTRYLSKASGEDVGGLYDLLGTNGYSRENITVETCRKNANALQSAVAKVPVSLALHRALQLCAEARGDKVAAEAEVTAFAALWKYAQQRAGTGAWGRPIRVVILNDAYAAFDAMGLEFDYAVYEDFLPHREFPIDIVGWDPERKVERHIRFDYVVAQAAIDRQNPAVGTAAHLDATAKGFIDVYAKAELPSALDAKAILTAMDKGSLADRVAAMQQMSAKGGLLSLSTLMMVCGLKPYAGCADGLVDALLPLAEKKQGMAMVLLSTAYRNGIGIARDEKAADLLLDAADKQWWQRGASLLATKYHAALHPKGDGMSAFDQRLAQAAAVGNPEAGPWRIALALDVPPGKIIDAAGICELSKPENNASGYGYQLISANLSKHGDKAGALEWEVKAAAAGDAESSREVAHRWIVAHPSQTPDTATLDLLKSAALAGDRMAQRELGLLAIERNQWREAELQLVPAMTAGDLQATYMLAGLWAQGFKELKGTPESARKVYEALAASPDGARARRELALLTLAGRAGIPKDSAKARALVMQDVRSGDIESQAMYGAWLLNGTGGAKDVTEGRRLLDKAIAAKSHNAVLAYGAWLLQQSDVPADHVHGLKLLQQAEAEGSTTARNNLAWAYCTSRFADLRAADKGLVMAKRMQDMDKLLDPGTLDTVAACYAAAGQFDEAVRLQESVVAQAPAWVANGPGAPESLKNMADRLALFRKHRAYTELVTSAP